MVLCLDFCRSAPFWLLSRPTISFCKDVNFGEPFIFTTTKDDRVGPVHARKFAAKMEEFDKPFYYDEIVEGGHGAGADLKEEAKTWATEYTYLTRKLME